MVYLFLADGTEEVEALSVVDILRRSKIDVLTVGVTGKTILSSHKVKIECDITVAQMELSSSLEAVIIPGGMPGTLNIEASDAVQKAIDFSIKQNIPVCAVCAAPLILGHKGLLCGKHATCYPGFEKDLSGAELSTETTVKDGNIITSRGMGTAIEFALQIVSTLRSKELSENVAASIEYKVK